MDTITKQNFITQLKINTDLILDILKTNKVDNSNTTFRNFFKNKDNTMLVDTSFMTNGGDVRSMDIFVYSKNSVNKVDKYIISLEDNTIGCGKYEPLQSKPFSSPLVWQTSSFDMSQNTHLELIKNKKTTLGTKIEWDSQIDIILKPLYDIFFRTTQNISDYYYAKNIQTKKTSLVENKLTDIKFEDLKIQTVQFISRSL
jgi:hypothetical protein